MWRWWRSECVPVTDVSVHIHVAGVAGVGMSALAELLLATGFTVTGSDRSRDQGLSLEVLQVLERAGVRLVPQDGAVLTPATRALVVSTAIEEDNAEIAAARRLGVEVVHRAEMLARLAGSRRLVAVTGTAGKTTVTGLLGYLLEYAGFDPTVVNGGVVLNWRTPQRLGNVRAGRGGLWIIEADESDRSLLRFHPESAVITNVSKDHFELEEVVQLFRAFAGQVRQRILSGPGVGRALGIPTDEPRVPVERRATGWCFRVDGEHFDVPMPGRHNAENAVLAVLSAQRLGVPLRVMREALPSFRGIHRRLEVVGTGRGVRVLDDYAHNPAKLGASWRAVAETAARVHGYWRPHGYGPLALMQSELVEAFAEACRPGDRLFILPVFYAGGTAKQVVTAEDFVASLRARGVPAEFVPDYATLEAALLGVAKDGDAVLGMGARDPELPWFAQRLVARLRAGA